MNFLQDDLLTGLPVAEKPPRKIATPPSPPLSAAPVEESPMLADEHDESPAEEKAPSAFKTISEVASFLSVPQHVLRFWESRFSQIKPLKLRGGRRYYRPEDIEVLSTIKGLLYKQGYTINGAKKAFNKDKAPAMEAPAPAQPVKAKAPVTDKQKNQLTVVRHELMALRDVLKPYVY